MRYFVHCRSPKGASPCTMHQNGCVLFPDPESVELLGDFDGANDALQAAQERFGIIRGCRFCCPECHLPQRAGGAPSAPGAPNGQSPR